MSRTIDTNGELADACGVTPGAVSQWKRADDFPVRKDPPWTQDDVITLKAWRQTRKLDPTSPDVRAVDLRLKAERMLKVKLEREILAGHYVPIDDVKQEWGNITRSIRSALTGVGAAIAARWPGPDAGRLQAMVDNEISDRLRRYAKDGMTAVELEEAALAAA